MITVERIRGFIRLYPKAHVQINRKIKVPRVNPSMRIKKKKVNMKPSIYKALICCLSSKGASRSSFTVKGFTQIAVLIFFKMSRLMSMISTIRVSWGKRRAMSG